jgi:D-alanine-D-alanine ligase
MHKKLNAGILFGGKSAEHEVSIQSALNVYDAIDRSLFTPYLIGIDKTGSWFFQPDDAGQFVLNRDDPARIALAPSGTPAALLPAHHGCVYSLATMRPLVQLDVVFPLLHGPLGEDGTVQGLLKLAGIPFVGSGVLGSAAGMDKDASKRLLRDAGIPVTPWYTYTAASPDFDQAPRAFGLPLFVKPANMGSSVGVNKAHTQDEYRRALREAFRYDTKVLVEKALAVREIECAVLGNDEPAASVPGEIISNHEFYSYDAKYIDAHGAALAIPAQLPAHTADAARSLAIAAFRALCCQGLGRVDLFLCESGDLLVNEINTMPGFTKISMYPKLWEASGLSYTPLITRLLTLATERYTQEEALSSQFSVVGSRRAGVLAGISE